VPIAIFTYLVLSACELVLEGASNKGWKTAGSATVSFTKQAKDAADTPPRKSLLDTIVTSKPTVSTIPINAHRWQLQQPRTEQSPEASVASQGLSLAR
jgi:hypothetical protein